MRIYRAAAEQEPYLGCGSCWTETLDAARAYTDDPGFGGPAIYAVEVDDRYEVLDLVCSDPYEALASALYADADERRASLEDWETSGFGWAVYHVWEERPQVADLLRQRGGWVRYEDDYPEGSVTWRYMGVRPLAARRCG